MTPFLLQYLCEPVTKASLSLQDPSYDNDGNIISGKLKSTSGKVYPIVNGVPRFLENVSTETVESFGDEWNYFNFIDFKSNWLQHTVKNTFGSPDVFRDKIIIDAGGGSGAQTKWFAEYGAKHVILLDLSHSLDGIVEKNLSGIKNVDAIQCSIDAPPLKDQSIDGIVYCHNVIQHTASVEKTAHALYAIVDTGGEFVFNCYPLNDKGMLRWIRFHVIYKFLRKILSRLPFKMILAYSKSMSVLRLMPGLGTVLEKTGFCIQGDIPKILNERFLDRLKRRYKATCLNTFDAYGSHSFQHHKSNDEISLLVKALQPNKTKVLNAEKYFERPQPIGCALRIFK